MNQKESFHLEVIESHQVIGVQPILSQACKLLHCYKGLYVFSNYLFSSTVAEIIIENITVSTTTCSMQKSGFLQIFLSIQFYVSKMSKDSILLCTDIAKNSYWDLAAALERSKLCFSRIFSHSWKSILPRIDMHEPLLLQVVRVKEIVF